MKTIWVGPVREALVTSLGLVVGGNPGLVSAAHISAMRRDVIPARDTSTVGRDQAEEFGKVLPEREILVLYFLLKGYNFHTQKC